MKSLKLSASAAIIAMTMSACSSSIPEPETSINQRLVELEQQQLEMAAREQARAQAAAEVEMEMLPEWVENPPEADGTGFYGVGIAQSKQLNHSRKSARLQAEFELAKAYRQELSGSERAFEQGNTEGDVVSQTTFLIDKIVDAVPVVGYQVVDQQIKAHNGVFYTYTLLKLPYDDFNRVLQQQKSDEQDQRIQVLFDDLERRLDKRRAQTEADAQSEHERELEQMRTRADILNGPEKPEDETKTPVIELKPQA